MNMAEIRGLSLDIGGSELRSWHNDGEEKIQKYSNDFYRIAESDFRRKDAVDKMGVVRVVCAPKSEYCTYIGQGLTGKMYEGEALTLANGRQKTGNPDYYLQFVYLVARDAMAAKLRRSEREAVNCSETEPDYEYVIGITIPIREHAGANDCPAKFKKSVAGTYLVRFPLVSEEAEVSFCIKEANIGVVPEGGVCITGLRKELNEDMVSLVIDMGHVTTDIALFRGQALYGKPISSQWAGNTLIANIKMSLMDRGFNLTTEQVQKVLETGKVLRGKADEDVKEMLRNEKYKFVRNYLKEEILQLLSANRIAPSQVTNIVPIGAPMNDNGTGSISRYCAQEIGAEYADIKLLAEDLRYVNITQTDMFTQILYRRAVSGR